MSSFETLQSDVIDVMSRFKLQDDVSEYVSSVVISYIRSDVPGTSLFSLYERALSQQGGFLAFKVLGDTSLFTSGVFPDYVSSSPCSNEYYIRLGQLGYNSASAAALSDDVTRLLVQLTHEFPRIVDALNELSCFWNITKPDTMRDLGMIRKYDDQATWQKFIRQGVVPMIGSGEA